MNFELGDRVELEAPDGLGIVIATDHKINKHIILILFDKPVGCWNWNEERIKNEFCCYIYYKHLTKDMIRDHIMSVSGSQGIVLVDRIKEIKRTKMFYVEL